jgi:glycosyltransferase involved in cell wall biosynthesis
MIRVGPTHALGEFAPECELLSQRFAGEFWSYGSFEADVQIGRFHLRVVKDHSRYRLFNFLRFAGDVRRRVAEFKLKPIKKVVVTSYDPYLGGLLASWVAHRIKSVFVCEVNGTYGNPDNFAHLKGVVRRRFRQLLMRVIGYYVLRRANAVRLLFAEQLKDFVTLRHDTVVRQFFALTYTDRFAPGPEEPIILAVGYPFMRKGVDVLAQAFICLAPRYPDWKLVLIGHLIPDELRAHGLEHKQIQALPGMPQEELAKWISRCAILALASRSEAMGRVLLEVAAAGKCRIATRVDGIPMVISDGVDGVLVEKNQINELATGLAKLMDDKTLRHRLGATAKQRVTLEFSPAVYLNHYTELITAALKKTVL